MKPKRDDLSYLIGWFKPQVGGNHKEARKLAEHYRRHSQK